MIQYMAIEPRKSFIGFIGFIGCFVCLCQAQMRNMPFACLGNR